MKNGYVNLNQKHFDEVKEQLGWKYKDFCDFWHYNHVNEISYISTGKRRIHRDLLENLAEKVGCRVEYLLSYDCGGDDFFSKEELNRSITNNRISEYNKTIEYFKILGIDIELNAYLFCTPAFIVTRLDEWKDKIEYYDQYKDEINQLNVNNDHLSLCFKLKAGFSWNEYDWITKDGIDYETVTKYSIEKCKNTITKDSNQSSDFEFLLDDDCEIHIMYEVAIDKEVVNLVPVAKMNDFLKSIDNVCKTAASTLLSSDTFSNEIFKWLS